MSSLDRNQRPIEPGDFICVRPVNLARYENTEVIDPAGHVIGRVAIIENLGPDVGIMEWTSRPDDTGELAVVLRDYFRAGEAAVILKANGLPPL